MEFVEQLKASIDIVTVVGEYVRLRKAGASPRYTGLCPFHTEKTPSFSVHSAHGFYKCFGCGVSGDAIKFIMEIERLTFWEAIKLLAERNGIPLPKRTEQADEETRRNARLYEMHEIAVRHFREALHSPAGREAKAYLARRGVRGDMAEEFALGFAERGGQVLVRILERAGFSHDEMELSGLALKRQDGSGVFDRFRGRLMFPIHSESGKAIAFGGRALSAEDEPKYLNSAETPIYRKSWVLYNLHRAKEGIRKNLRSVLVEGYMDVIGVYTAGIKEVVATCGTALTPMQVRALKRHSDHLIVNFDPDAAGSNATEKSIQVLLEEGMRLKVLSLSGGLDPDEYVQKNGADGYREALDKSRGYFFWLADRARTKHDMNSADGRIAGFQFLLPAILRMPDKLERMAVANDVADYLRVEPGMVLDQFRKAVSERSTAPPRRVKPEPPDPAETLLLHAILGNPEAREEVVPVLSQMAAVKRFRTRRIFEAIFRILDGHQEPAFAALEARLEEADRNLLAAALMAEEAAPEVSTEQAVACVRKLRAAEQATTRSDIKAKMKEAERRGDLQQAMALMRELRELES